MSEWEYDPIPRYLFYLGDALAGEVVFDGHKPNACNDWAHDGEVWRGVANGYLVGRFSNHQRAMDAVRANILNRGLTLVGIRRPADGKA